jgi:hypothetical protein
VKEVIKLTILGCVCTNERVCQRKWTENQKKIIVYSIRSSSHIWVKEIGSPFDMILLRHFVGLVLVVSEHFGRAIRNVMHARGVQVTSLNIKFPGIKKYYQTLTAKGIVSKIDNNCIRRSWILNQGPRSRLITNPLSAIMLYFNCRYISVPQNEYFVAVDRCGIPERIC